MICHSKGIARLQEAILDAAVQATDPHTKEKVIGMMVCVFSLDPLLNDKHFSSFHYQVCDVNYFLFAGSVELCITATGCAE